MAELRLPFGLSVELDALYRYYRFQVPGVSNVHTGAWEFPLSTKYRFAREIVRPYIEAGLAADILMRLHSISVPSCSPRYY